MIPIRTSVEVDEIPGAVVGLIIANVAVFLVQVGLPADLREAFILHNALVPARYTDTELARELGLDPGNLLPLFTNGFMHVGWLHLIVNMWTLWLFGRALEERLGAVRFLLLYLVCGAIASLAHLGFNLSSPVPALGASGAIAGILGGYTLLYPRAKIVVLAPVLFFPAVFRLPAVAYTGIWFVLQLVQGIADLVAPEPTAGIAWWAHIGGFVAGLALVRPVGRPRRRARMIGAPRGRTREVGAQISRVRTVGPQRPRVQLVGASGRGTGRLRTLVQPRRLAQTLETRVQAVETVRTSVPITERAEAPLQPRRWAAETVRTSVPVTETPGESVPTATTRRRSPWD